MSRVTVTELPPGDPATSTSINDTITSWNTALAAGAIGTNNVRLEGLDRRTFGASTHAILGFYSQATAGNTGMVTAAAYTALATSADFTPTAGGDIIVRGSTFCVGQDDYATTQTVVTVALQRSTDGGATWATLPNTVCVRRCKTVNSARVTGNTYTFYKESTPVRVRYRLAYIVTPGNAEFRATTLVVEQLAR